MYSYRVKKGRVKEFYDNCLFKEVLGNLFFSQKVHFLTVFFKVVGRRTAFEVDWLFEKTLSIFYGNESFSSIVSAHNDFFNERFFL